MRFLRSSLYWLYDFLAEDVTLLVGVVVAIVVTLVVVRANHSVAGFVLWGLAICSVILSVLRTALSRP